MVSRFWRAGGNALAPGGFEAAVAEEVELGPEMMVNGDCSGAHGWTMFGDTAIAGGQMAGSDFQGCLNAGVASAEMEIGATYRCTMDILFHGGEPVRISLGDVAGPLWNTTGTKSVDLLCEADALFGAPSEWGLAPAGFGAELIADNFSCRKILA